MRIIAFITEATPIHHILEHIGEPHDASPSAKGPPDWADEDQTLTLEEAFKQDLYEYESVQRVSW